jgi:hypothetical protein
MEEKNKSEKVIMVEDGPVNIRFTQRIKNFIRLGREMKISPKANASVNEAGYKVEYFVDTVSVCIGIGKDHTAELIMTMDAWWALHEGARIHIETTEEFKKKYVYKK